MKWTPKHAETLPFSRTNVAAAIGMPKTKVANWIDRNRLWQTQRHSYYRLSDIFDLAGFAALRVVGIAERDCARYVYNFGFFRAFLHGQQIAQFSFRDGQLEFGSYNQSAAISIVLNMRTIGHEVFQRIGEGALRQPLDWPDGTFESFKKFYIKAVEIDRLDCGSIKVFEESEP